MMRAMRTSFLNVGITASLANQNSPNREWVMQIGAGRRVHELKHHTARQRFAPKELVVSAECRTPSVRIVFWVIRGVRPKIEGDVNSTVRAH
jgi:hypothetical protein